MSYQDKEIEEIKSQRPKIKVEWPDGTVDEYEHSFIFVGAKPKQQGGTDGVSFQTTLSMDNRLSVCAGLLERAIQVALKTGMQLNEALPGDKLSQN